MSRISSRPLREVQEGAPKRVEDMTPEERLASLREFAEEKKYVRPGEDGTLPGGVAGMQALVFGGPMSVRGEGPKVASPKHGAPRVLSESEDGRNPEISKATQQSGGLKGWLQRKMKKNPERSDDEVRR